MRALHEPFSALISFFASRFRLVLWLVPSFSTTGYAAFPSKTADTKTADTILVMRLQAIQVLGGMGERLVSTELSDGRFVSKLLNRTASPC